MKASVALLVGALWLPSGSAAGPAVMVKDINRLQGPFEVIFFGFQDSAALDGFAFFRANDGVHGEELWRWSPVGGVEMVADICSGACSSMPFELVVFEDEVYFRADDGAHGVELWATAGTRATTRLVADIEPGLAPSTPLFLTAMGDRLFFAAGPGLSSTRDLWATDGTAEGTAPVAPIHPDGDARPTSLTAFDGRLYFTADDGATGRELWRTDGSMRGTERVADLCPGIDDCFWEEQWVPQGSRVLQPLGSRLVVVPFAAGVSGMLAFDPTDDSFEQLAEDLINNFFPFPRLGDTLFFGACEEDTDCELWRTDGSASGTFQVKDIRAGVDGSSPNMLGAAGGLVFFYASGDGEGAELWRTDGSEQGTLLVKDIRVGPESSRPIVINPGIPLGELLVFGATEGVHGIEPWVTDGTEQGTVLLADTSPGPGSGLIDWFFPYWPAPVAGEFVFLALAGDLGHRLWSTDGTPAGTSLVADLDTQTSSLPEFLFYGGDFRAGAVEDRLLFGADDGLRGTELWTSDGTEEGTHLVADLVPGGPLDSGRPMFFGDGDPDFVSGARGAWATDGTEMGTLQLTSGTSGSPVRVRTPAEGGGSQAFFRTDTSLYVSDGTPAGTVSLAGMRGDQLLLLGDQLLFAGHSPVSGSELWTTDGTAGSTEPLVDLWPGPSSSAPEFLGFFRGRLLFAADDGEHGAELWRTDGSAAGTELVADLREDGEGSAPSHPDYASLAAVTDRGVFFTADDGVTGRELWMSNGTALGTRQLLDLRPGSDPSEPSGLVTLGTKVFFFADDGEHGREPWVTNGSRARTRRLRDIRPGETGSAVVRRFARGVVAANGRVYFAADDGVAGMELWVSDGTTVGTRLLQDINPGPGASSPENFVVSGDCLYFSATDGEHGYEPWVMSLTGDGRECSDEPAAAEPRQD